MSCSDCVVCRQLFVGPRIWMYVTVHWGRAQDRGLESLKCASRSNFWSAGHLWGLSAWATWVRGVSQCDVVLRCPGQAAWLAHWVDGNVVMSHARHVTPQCP